MDRAEKVRVIGEKAHKLGELKNQPGWAILKNVYEKERDRHYKELTRVLVHGTYPDKQKLEYVRGYIDGMRKLIENPERAEHTFSEALRHANVLRGDDS